MFLSPYSVELLSPPELLSPGVIHRPETRHSLTLAKHSQNWFDIHHHFNHRNWLWNITLTASFYTSVVLNFFLQNYVLRAQLFVPVRYNDTTTMFDSRRKNILCDYYYWFNFHQQKFCIANAKFTCQSNQKERIIPMVMTIADSVVTILWYNYNWSSSATVTD